VDVVKVITGGQVIWGEFRKILTGGLFRGREKFLLLLELLYWMYACDVKV
jgi:hypothetical protein